MAVAVSPTAHERNVPGRNVPEPFEPLAIARDRCKGCGLCVGDLPASTSSSSTNRSSTRSATTPSV